MSISPEYLLADGSPRYGVRRDGAEPPVIKARPADPRLIARDAARLGLHHLAAAVDSRLTRSWADQDDPLLATLRARHAAELAEAESLVKAELGGRTAWLRRARANHGAFLAPAVGRRKADGRYGAAALQRAVLVLALTGAAGFVAVATHGDVLALLIAGLAVCGLAYLLGGMVTERLRLPVPARLRGIWLQEIRRDITDATLLAILRAKGADVDAPTARAAGRGWAHLQTVAATVDGIHAGS
ncbi:hypothetical protein LVY72_23670 [Arthrobacter sp. I2-34]|uniref:TIGR04222 domain-containing membrane protein n=1 Tax=Arthrobacter hankyongi TaxID=2904801 RepID=A0ABS9LDY3_9MICC|nr:hypothetical protein [Arthrobacter hankyongi]MCG2624893.1 hypothetical protein [Arthrobacter hankyongi]